MKSRLCFRVVSIENQSRLESDKLEQDNLSNEQCYFSLCQKEEVSRYAGRRLDERDG